MTQSQDKPVRRLKTMDQLLDEFRSGQLMVSVQVGDQVVAHDDRCALRRSSGRHPCDCAVAVFAHKST